MRTTIIPAQITTVEDKIVGNLNLTQIFILMVPVFWTTILFAFVPPVMKLVGYKIGLILAVIVMCLILALRIKGRVVFNWLILLLKFKIKPAYFIFNKNDNYLREMEMPIIKKKQKTKVLISLKVLNKNQNKLTESESIKLFQAINQEENSLSFKLSNKGGLNVAFEQIKK
jgi:hypothetical protein